MPAARLLIAMHLFALVVSFAAALANAGRFKVIDHDKIVALTQDASDAELKWQPYLKTDGHSCVPFPAVDVDGAVSGGLFPGGPVDGDCESNTGQAYVRWKPVASTDHGETIAYMYAWYLVSISSPHRYKRLTSYSRKIRPSTTLTSPSATATASAT